MKYIAEESTYLSEDKSKSLTNEEANSKKNLERNLKETIKTRQVEKLHKNGPEVFFLSSHHWSLSKILDDFHRLLMMMMICLSRFLLKMTFARRNGDLNTYNSTKLGC